MTVYVLFPDNLGNSDYIVNLVQLMELIIMPLFFFLFFVWMFLFVLCGYSPVTPNKIVNPSECCSLPHGHAFSSIFCCVLAISLERVLLEPWGAYLAPLSLGFPPGLSTPFPCTSLFLSLIGSLGSLSSGVYSFI